MLKHQNILLFWYLESFLEKDKTDLTLQINIGWSVFTGLTNWRGFYLLHIWTIQLSSLLNFKVYIRFIVFLQISFRFLICWQLCCIRCLCSLCISFTCWLFLVKGRVVKSLDGEGELKSFKTGKGGCKRF